MKRLLALLLFLALAGCTAGPGTDPADVAPPDTISRIPSTAPPVPPSVAARENGATVAAALPKEVPGYTKAATPPVLKLCPTAPQKVPGDIVHAFGAWTAAGGRSLYVTAVLDPQHAPADQLLGTLAPQDCPDRDDAGNQYVYDRQPYESPEGWTGSLNTSLVTAPGGQKSYEAVYLLSNGDALVNVAASGPVGPAVTFDAAIDQTAADYLKLVLNRFAA